MSWEVDCHLWAHDAAGSGASGFCVAELDQALAEDVHRYTGLKGVCGYHTLFGDEAELGSVAGRLAFGAVLARADLLPAPFWRTWKTSAEPFVCSGAVATLLVAPFVHLAHKLTRAPLFTPGWLTARPRVSEGWG